MGNVLTIFRREMAAYFTGPVGYVFLSAFLLFLNLLAFFIVQRFFDYPVADTRPYFHVLAGVGSFLVAAVTMRLWSEERKENTFELLLTLPLPARDLVLGKFFAALAFYSVGLVLTLVAPVMMIALSRDSGAFFGLLDVGATLGGYLGAWLCGALFVAFGLWVSGLCRDQVVAFVLTAPALFFAYILGIPWVQQAMNAALDGLGRPDLGGQFGRIAGVFHHYDNLARGLVDLGDILFFVVWTVLFLILNVLTVERRGRPGANVLLTAATVLVFGIGAVGNWLLSGTSLGRWDATSDRIFTVSPVSARVLGKMEDKLRVRYHVSPSAKIPEAMRSVERDLRDQLDALRQASGGKLEYEVIVRHDLEDVADPEALAADDPDALQQALFRRIRPFPVAVSGAGSESVQLVYSALELIYGGDDRETEIIGQVVPSAFDSGSGEEAGIAQLEYRIVNYVNRMTRERAPKIALVAPLRETSPQLLQLFLRMGRQPPPPEDPFAHLASFLDTWENYEVQRVRLAPGDVVPDDCAALVVVAPESLSPRQRYEIARALVRGTPTLLAVQRDVYDYNITRAGYEGARRPLHPDIDDLLPPGVALTETMLVDTPPVNTFVFALPIQTALGTLTQAFPSWPMQVVLGGESLAVSDPVFDQVTRLRWLWGNALELDDAALSAAGLGRTVLLRASATAALRKPLPTLSRSMLRPPNADDAVPPGARPVLAVRLTGTFPFPYDERPDWPPEVLPPDAPPPAEADGDDVPEPVPGELVLLANAYLWSREGLDLTAPYPELGFFLNLVGDLALSPDDQAIRTLRDKQATHRFIRPPSPEREMWWKVVLVAGPVLLLLVAGVGVMGFRKFRRERYERKMTGD